MRPMRINYFLLPAIIVSVIFITLAGCTAPADKAASDEKDLKAGIPEEPSEKRGDFKSIEEDTTPPVDATGDAWEPPPDPLDEYIGDPEEDVAEMAMGFAEKLGYDTSKMFVIAYEEIFRSAEVWIWSVDLEGENGPVARAFVRLNLDYIEAFDSFPEQAPQAVAPGEEQPNLTAEAIGLSGMGYRPESWLSQPGFMVYRKHVSIGEWNVCVGNIMVRYIPETGVLIAVNRRENEPVDDFTMGVDRDAAIKDAASYLKISGSTPTQVELIQLQDGPSRFTDLNIYWEVKFDAGFIYVRCNDGNIVVSEIGPSEPMGF